MISVGWSNITSYDRRLTLLILNSLIDSSRLGFTRNVIIHFLMLLFEGGEFLRKHAASEPCFL